MALREFDCALCQQRFTLLSGDLIIPGSEICDKCLKVVWDLEGDALFEYIIERLKQQSPGKWSGPESEKKWQNWANGLVQNVGWQKGRWSNAGEAVGARERDRLVFKIPSNSRE